jgi:hypothetical protein
LNTSDMINAILLPYGAMGGAIAIFLPFLIFFFFVHTSVPGSFGRRAAWFAYGAVFLVFLFYKVYNGAGGVGEAISQIFFFIITLGSSGLDMGSNDLGGAAWIYWLGMIFILLSLFFDRTIHNYFEYSDFEKAEENINRSAKLDLLKQLDEARRLGSERDVESIKARLRRMGAKW